MKFYTLYRENNNFDDIKNDALVKKYADTKISWYKHFMIGISTTIKDSEQYVSLLTLKYGEDMIDTVCKDFTPIAGVDYVPIRKSKSTN